MFLFKTLGVFDILAGIMIILTIGDIPTANQAREMAGKIEQNFIPAFWEDEKGFICDSFDPAEKIQLQSFPIFSLLFLESPFGFQLLKNQVEKSAEFIENHKKFSSLEESKKNR